MKTEIEILWNQATDHQRHRLQAEVIKMLIAILGEYRPEVAEMARIILETDNG